MNRFVPGTSLLNNQGMSIILIETQDTQLHRKDVLHMKFI